MKSWSRSISLNRADILCIPSDFCIICKITGVPWRFHGPSSSRDSLVAVIAVSSKSYSPVIYCASWPRNTKQRIAIRRDLFVFFKSFRGKSAANRWDKLFPDFWNLDRKGIFRCERGITNLTNFYLSSIEGENELYKKYIDNNLILIKKNVII